GRGPGGEEPSLPGDLISAPQLDDPALREADELARLLASRQHADWRELRFEPFTSPLIRTATASVAVRMRNRFWQPSPAGAQARPEQAREAGSPAVATEPAGTAGRVV